MTVITRVVAIALLVTGLAVVTASAQQGQPPPEQQNEFIPIDELPPQDQLPAAPLLIGAYAFVVVVLFGYVFSIARRLGTVQREVERLESDMKKSARG